MRRFVAAIALSTALGVALAPALAAACCEAASPHACCARNGDDTATTATRAPCCKASPATATPRGEAVPGAAERVVIPVALLVDEAPAFAWSSAPSAPPHRSVGPPPALGPPLPLRI